MTINEIFQNSKNKTRVLILGSDLEELVLHILNFNGVNFDFFSENASRIQGNDFILYFTDDSQKAAEFCPTIFFRNIIDFSKNSFEILKNITSGGVFIYPENEQISEIINSSENYFRKLPYQTVDFENRSGKFFINTTFGELPLAISNDNLVKNLEGVRLLCQQFGLQEEDYYEALVGFS